MGRISSRSQQLLVVYFDPQRSLPPKNNLPEEVYP